MVVFRGSPYVPSHSLQVKNAFTELYNISKKDVLVDIGSGDGLVLRAAAKLGARAVGYEINPILVVVSKLLSRKYKNINVMLADFWLTNLPDNVTVVYVFSVTRDVKKIVDKIQKEANRLKRSIYIISYGGEFKCIKSIKNLGAHFLYKVEPLQPSEAQV